MPKLAEEYHGLLFAVAVPVLYLLLVLAGRRLKRQHGVRLNWFYHFFALGLALYLPAILLGLQWTFLRHLGAAVAVLSATVLIALIDRYVWDLHFQRHHQVQVPKFLTQLVGLVILATAIFLVLVVGYGQSIKGLLIAPGVAAIILGFAMQDLLGNIIAGVALQIGKPFVHGDWLLIDNRYAEVIEINWRSTRLLTNDHVCIEIPNREVARQTIVNLNRPQRLHATRISISVDFAAPPTRVKDVLLHAAANAKGVAAEPRPKVFLKNFGDSAIEYEIKFWMENHALYNDICDAIRTNAWYGLRRQGIRIPFPTRTLQLERPARDKQQEVQTTARVILRQQPLFRFLTDQQLDALLPRGRVVHFGQGEKLIQQGEQGESMFILVNGRAQVLVERNGAPKQVAGLQSGDCFGEMSLLTGEPRSATVIAQTDCEVVEISKPVLAHSLKEYPELLNELSQLLARRQLDTEGILAVQEQTTVFQAKQTRYAASFLHKLRRFFEL